MKTFALKRRNFILAALALPLLTAYSPRAQRAGARSPWVQHFAKLEQDLDGRLGVFALNTADGRRLRYRASERFPFCSTFKVMVAAAILHRTAAEPELLSRRIGYSQTPLEPHSPITERHVATGMAVADLCAAALQYSDNTATNLLLNILGGTSALMAFARSLGDFEFRLDRWEPELNSAIPNDPRDTTTPEAMALSLQRLLIGDALEPIQRTQLRDWMLGNTTGAARIKAGIPAGWAIADKTGSGAYGTANDIAVLWPEHRAPVVVAIYTSQRKKAAKPRDDIIAAAAKVVVDWLGQGSAPAAAA